MANLLGQLTLADVVSLLQAMELHPVRAPFGTAECIAESFTL